MSSDNQENNITMDIENKDSTPTPLETTLNSVPPEQNDNLTLSVLVNIKNLVDIAIKRGAYQPNEVSTVGKIYDQYVLALNKLSEQAKQVSNSE